ncbi:hypothetical protein CLAVI_000896 [Candidatus Clavichlamydia salmonicola]|uniref:hypothetical protein n=1 Tax=Candidatus Clavichlamydia salmonicola TaxID=469812 RepID=UPI00189153DC|nr:hypothetical protein [Candidatus Clavichlamydia salmonicola]MBF5051255.1 hypothetical protein [Candidatus Clavichlamydia salmonicola]
MTTSINPFSIIVNLVKEKKKLIMLPFQQNPSLTFHIRSHLSTIAEQIQIATLHQYSFVSAMPLNTAPSTSTEICSSVINLQQLISRLHSWIVSNQSIIQSSCGPTFYQKMLTSFTLTQTMLSNSDTSFSPPPTICVSDPSSIKKSYLGKKRLSKDSKKGTSRSESFSPPLKKKLLATSSFEKCSVSVEKQTPCITTDSLQEIVVLTKEVFTIQPAQNLDLESWICHTHQMVRNALNFSEICYVKHTKAASVLKKQSLTKLYVETHREKTLKKLKKLLAKQKPFLKKMPANLNKDPAIHLHTHLKIELAAALKQLKNTSLKLKKALKSPSPLPSIDSFETASPLPSEIKIQRTVPGVQYKPNKIALKNTIQKFFISIKIFPNLFNLSSREKIEKETELMFFLKQVHHASQLPQYICSQDIPEIDAASSVNKESILLALYHAVERNVFLFKQFHLLSEPLQENVDKTLNMINKKYCAIKSCADDINKHHKNFQKYPITKLTPPQPISSIYALPLITIYYNPKHPHIINIRKIFITASDKTLYWLLKNWKKSLSHHKKRMLEIATMVFHKNLVVQCHDKSWLLESNQQKLLPHQLLKVLLAIAKHNYHECLLYFKDTQENNNEEIHYPGYTETESLLKFVVTFLENFDMTNPYPQPVEAPPKKQPPPVLLFFMYKSYSSYEPKLHTTSMNKKYDVIRNMHQNLLKTMSYLKNLSNGNTATQILYNGQHLENQKDALALVYWGLDYNYQFLMKNFNHTFDKTKNSMLLNLYQDSLTLIQEEQALATTYWGKKYPNSSLPNLDSLKHPLKNELSNLSKVLQTSPIVN